MSQGINVLSLFDGMSVWKVALEDAWIKINKYFASEIDKYAIQISIKNHPDIIHVWDVTKLQMRSMQWQKRLAIASDDNKSYFAYAWWEKIDLLIWWSPCQWFSRSWLGLNFEDPRSKLFFEFVRLLKEIKPKYFLLENVNMKKEWQDIISEALWVEPVKINSKLFTAQNRPRTYWTNIPFDRNIPQSDYKLSDYLDPITENTSYINDYSYENIVLEKKSDHLIIKNATKCWFLVWYPWDNVNTSFVKSKTKRWRVKKNMVWCLVTSLHEGIITDDLNIRYITLTETERLQWLLDDYTKWVPDTQRQTMLWNGWERKTVSYLFKGIESWESNKKYNSLLRFIMIKYGDLIEFPNLYEIYRDRVLKVKSITELSEDKKQELIWEFQAWIDWIESWFNSIETENIYILNQITWKN